MIAYNKTWLANLLLQNEVKQDLQNGCITDAEFKAIAAKYPVGFYTPNLFVRVGLFILTCVIISFSNGLLTLLLASTDLIETPAWFLVLGIFSYAALEFMVNSNHHYRSGVDDALLFISACLFATGFAILFYHNKAGMYYLPLTGMIFLLNLYFTIRFADVLMATVSCIALLAFVFFGWTRIIPGGLTTVPFIMMLASAGLYWLSFSYNKKVPFIHYQNCLIIAQVISLATLYAAGNYYIIQTLSDELNGGRASSSIPFGTVFWVWTIGLPLVYVGFGVKRKDTILLRTGLLLIAAAVVTFRAYYHILPVDIMLVIAGAVILGIAYGVMKYLKTPKHGFTYAETNDPNLMDHLKIESLLVAETFSTAPSAPADIGVKFGGGDFGGGGSSSNF